MGNETGMKGSKPIVLKPSDRLKTEPVEAHWALLELLIAKLLVLQQLLKLL